MRLSYLFIGLVAVCYTSCHSRPVAKEIRPNILLINIDDMGWKDVGFMGSDYYETPNLDSLSAQGMIFTNGYAAAANCAPSRACLMTGQWTPRHGIYTVGSSERGESSHRKLIPIPNTKILAPEHSVLPKILQNNGYTTCLAGKWHLSKDPLEYGFAVNIGGGHNGVVRSYYPPYRNVKITAGNEDYLTDRVMENAITFVDTVTEPFFLYYSPYAVHTPIQPVESLLEKYRQKPGSNGQQNPEYATMVENLDRNIGLLLRKMRNRSQLENTLIVFTSDNGGLYGITQQKPLRAGKGSYYEGGIREPFFFVYPDHIPAGATNESPITNLDIFPTLLQYAGVKAPQLRLDGKDLSHLLETTTPPAERALFWHFPIYLQAYNPADNENRDPLFRTRPGSVIRKGKWKLHYYFEDDDIELYDLEKDIGEAQNLAETFPAKKDELLQDLRAWWATTGAPIPSQANPDYRGE